MADISANQKTIDDSKNIIYRLRAHSNDFEGIISFKALTIDGK